MTFKALLGIPQAVRRGLVAVAACFLLSVPAAPLAAQQSDAPRYVGTDTCTDCHRDAAAAWQGSHHALAWTQPTGETVLGDFDDAGFEGGGMAVRFSRKDGGYHARVREADGSQKDYRIHSVAGIAPLQQYLIETEPGRLQSFDVVWDAVKERWYHLYPDQDLPPGDGLHWTGPYKTWNSRCAECHATGYQRNFSTRSGRYASTQAEIGVGCEACHGPGSAHLDWAKGQPLAEGSGPYGFTAQFGTGGARDAELCAGCHSRREPLSDGNPLPGTDYADAYNLSLLHPGLYHADGQILDEVYVYGSFLQSKMARSGVGCMNCHDPHAARLKAEGNAVCTQCHSPAGNPDFPTLQPAEYDTPDHTRHPMGSEGAQCKSCHMIERTYMGIDGRRDHSFRIPRPDLGAQTGGPDACTDCHSDRDQPWAAAQIEGWFPDPARRGPHYGQVLAAGRQAPDQAAGALVALAGDADQPGIVRATALAQLVAVSDPAIARATAGLLADPDPLIRAGAAGVQRGAEPEVRIDRLTPVLADPMLSVRIAAAREMLGTDPSRLSRSQRAVLDVAMADWQGSMAKRMDFPETHVVLGGIGLTLRDIDAARRAFGEAVRLDPQQPEIWTMLVRLAQATGDRDGAARVVDEALRYLPSDPGLLRLKSLLGG
jgi:predicted CXXCH cytochrome family protein